MGTDTAISAESGLPRRGAVAFIILLGTIRLFADMTYQGARSITGPYLGVLGVTASGIFNPVYGVAWFAGSVLLGILNDLSITNEASPQTDEACRGAHKI
jgi:hypothetical protein